MNAPGLSTIRVPDLRKTVMAFVTSLFGRPKPETAIVESGMASFLEAIEFQNTDYDRRLEKALSQQTRD